MSSGFDYYRGVDSLNKIASKHNLPRLHENMNPADYMAYAVYLVCIGVGLEQPTKSE